MQMRNILFFLATTFIGSSAHLHTTYWDVCAPKGFNDRQDRGEQCLTICKNSLYLSASRYGFKDDCNTQENPVGAYCTCVKWEK